MRERASMLRLSAVCGYAAAAVLVIMIILLAPLGERAILLESPYPVEAFANLLDQSGRRIAVSLVCDDLFAILYLAFFLGLAETCRRRASMFAWLGLGAGVATGLLDLLENARLMSIISNVANGYGVTPAEAHNTFVIAQVKFCCSYLALFCFAPGVWPLGRLGRLLAVLFVLFACLGPIAFVDEVIGVVRIPLMALGLGLGGMLLGSEAKVEMAKE